MLSGFQSGFLSIRPIGISFIISRTAVTASVTAHTLFGTGDGPPIKPESIGDFILQNVFELLEYVLSYLSNTVSFLRVGAFVLVHAGMMMVVFSLAGAHENIFVIILGNILVIALEGLLTGIQALRLEYYEMFSRFYEGGGTAFKPIKLNAQN